MSNNPAQENQEPSETESNSFFSRMTIDLKGIIIGIIIATISGAIVNYIIQNDILKRYESYENNDYNIQLKYPKKWSIQENLNTWQPEVRFLSPQENNTDDFQERVTISIESLSKALSINEYVAKATAQIEVSNTIVEPARETIFANKQGVEITYEEKTGNKIRKEVWMIKDQKAYIATYTAESNKFAKFAKQADKIMQSLLINKSD